MKHISFLFVACCQHPNSYVINIITFFGLSSFIYDLFHDVSSSDYIHIYVCVCVFCAFVVQDNKFHMVILHFTP